MTGRSALLLCGCFVFGLLGLSACDAKNQESSKMTPQESQRVGALTANPVTRCVGRYLVDLPSAFVLNAEVFATIDEVTIKVQRIDRDLFEHVLAHREASLRQQHMDGKPDKPVLRRIETSPTVQVGKVFNRAAGSGSAGIKRSLELHGWKGGYGVHLENIATDYPGAGFARPDDPPDNTAEKLRVLLDVYDRIRGRSNDEVPKEPGFCIAGGFVAGKPHEAEEAYIPFHLKDAPDVYFHVSVSPEKLKEDETLLQRSAKVEREMQQSGTKTIRKGEIVRGGQKFEEWLMKGPTPYRVPGTMFSVVTNEATPGVQHPFVELELFNGFFIPQPKDLSEEEKDKRGLYKDLERATLSEAEAIAIWDKVSPTLRQRPGAM